VFGACSASLAGGGSPTPQDAPPASQTRAHIPVTICDLPPDIAALLERMDARIRLLEQRVAESDRLIAELLSTKRQIAAPALDDVAAVPARQTPDAPVPDAPRAVATSTARDAPPASPPSEATPSPEPASSLATETESETRLPFSGYMDFHFNKPRDGESELDFHRFVLLFGHSFSDRLKFWSELELEHALVEGLEEKGELELEQAYVDYNIRSSLNLRAGMLLAPVGIINERHEPPAYYGVERPFVDTLIIPSTWFDTGAGLFGGLGRGLTYKAYVMAPLDATGFTAAEGIREGRQKGFLSNVRNVAFTGRVEHHAAPGLALGASVWSGLTGFNLRRVNPRVTLWDVDGRFSRGRLDIRGQYAQVAIGNAAELNAALQRSTGVNPNIARALRGFYLESGARVLPVEFPHDLAVFLRYENFDTQWRMPDGYLPLQEFDRDAWILGASYFLDPDIAFKVDYTWVGNRSEVVRPPRAFNLGLGWWF
jgi:hypothetical protein